MLFWIVIAVLTVVAAVFLLLPLLRQGRPVAADLAGEAAVYRDQLQELERDRAQGLIAASDADYARAEIARRLLSVSGKPAADSPAPAARRNVLAQAFIIIALPAIGLGLYLITGSPDMPSQPLEARLENPGNDIELLVAKAERHLAEKPDDGAGWDILAPIYFKSARYGDAEMAYRNAMRLLGPSTERLAGLAETLVTESDGIVTADARAAFEESVRLGGPHPRSSFYLALALEQDGKKDEARTAFEELAQKSPPGAPWLPLVSEHIVKNGGTALAAIDIPPSAGPTRSQVEATEGAAAGMSVDERKAMIGGMVESLSAKLKQDPNNFDGWVLLVRSHAMMNDTQGAIAALKAGLETFPADGEQGKQLIASARDLNLPVEEALK